MRGQTAVEKIVQRFVKQQGKVYSGDFVNLRPAHVMTHDNTAAVLQKYRKSFPGVKIFDPKQPVFTLDHNIQDKSEGNLKKYQDIQEFAKQQGIDFYPAGRGIGHQVVIEEGYARPFSLMVASDSHSNMYGGIGCLGSPVVRSDAVGLWVGGKCWWVVPKVVKVNLTGQLQPQVTGKDVIVALCSLFNQDDVLNCAVEFTGEGVRSLTIDQRLTIANMTTEWAAIAGLFPVDSATLEWYKQRTLPDHPRLSPSFMKDLEQDVKNKKFVADEGASYYKELTLDLSSLKDSYVSGPNAVKVGSPINKLEEQKIKVNKAYLVSCTNSRTSDIKAAADVFTKSGKRVHPDVEFYVAAASSLVQQQAEQLGYWQTLVKAGAKPLPSGCGPCIGLGMGLLKDGEVGISATNRNFKGRMGSRQADTYLASPAVVAASAIEGIICSPEYLQSGRSSSHGTPTFNINGISNQAPLVSEVDAVKGFETQISGRLLWCPQDNMNTDSIYPGKYTYQDGLTPQQMAKVAMENYDPNFQQVAQEGDILVGGKNFGSGSSREQAATCLKYRGIRLIIAESFSDIYKRNAFNNGLICLESPQLVQYLRSTVQDSTLTQRLQDEVHLDLSKGQIQLKDLNMQASRLGKVAQELIVAGGLENWVKL